MANKILEKTLNNAEQKDLQPGYGAPQVGADGGPVFPSASATGSGAMSVAGSARASLFLLAIVFGVGAWAWTSIDESAYGAVFFVALFAGMGLGFATAFMPKAARITAPLYAAAQGILLGMISRIYEDAYEGIVIQAVLATAAIAFVMYTLYSTGVIKVTPGFRRTVMFATLGIFAFYMLNLVLSLFGAQMPFIWDTGIMGIGFSVIVIGIASANLALDFDFIERGSAAGLPKYMNWAAAFGLVASLIWIYLEILRLLAKTRN